MPVITLDQAVEQMDNAVRNKLGTDELLEIHNELFPKDRYTEAEVQQDSRPLIQNLLNHIHSKMTICQLVALWHLIFISNRNVWYNEESDVIHYNEEADAVWSE